jgi:hypothetical protein
LVANPKACLTDQVLNSAVSYFRRIHRAGRYRMSVKLKISNHRISLHTNVKIQVSLLVWHQYAGCSMNLKEWWRVLRGI